jgi:outer membrane protein assembly factor BamB
MKRAERICWRSVLRSIVVVGCAVPLTLASSCSRPAAPVGTAGQKSGRDGWTLDLAKAHLVQSSISGATVYGDCILLSALRDTSSGMMTVRPGAHGGVVIEGLPYAELLSVSLDDGRIVWSTPLLQTPALSAPVVSDGRCLVVDGNGHAWVLDCTTGRVVWSACGIGYPLLVSDLFVRSFVFLGKNRAYSAGVVYASKGPGVWALVSVVAGSNHAEWTRHLPNSVALAYALGPHRLFLASPMGVTWVDPATGSNARAPVQADPNPLRLFYDGRHLFEVGCTSVRSLDLVSLKQFWVSRVAVAPPAYRSYPQVTAAVSDGSLLLGAQGPARIVCLDASTGSQRWVSNTPGVARWGVLSASDGVAAWASAPGGTQHVAVGVLNLTTGRQLLALSVPGPVRSIAVAHGHLVIVTASAVRVIPIPNSPSRGHPTAR